MKYILGIVALSVDSISYDQAIAVFLVVESTRDGSMANACPIAQSENDIFQENAIHQSRKKICPTARLFVRTDLIWSRGSVYRLAQKIRTEWKKNVSQNVPKEKSITRANVFLLAKRGKKDSRVDVSLNVLFDTKESTVNVTQFVANTKKESEEFANQNVIMMKSDIRANASRNATDMRCGSTGYA